MVILSVDYGDARTGIAACDALQMLASPVTVIHQTEKEPLADEICRIAAEKKAQKLVLGLPKNMDGSEGFRAQACREFAALLSEKSGLPVDFQDERLTTVSAHRLLHDARIGGRQHRPVVDQQAAVVILQTALDSRENR